MKISAHLENRRDHHTVTVATDGKEQTISIAPKASGFGSSANGGELLFLALASCYCNDIYREAARQGITVTAVEVEVQGEFGGPGDPARNVTYRARITAEASEEAIRALAAHTDRVAEIQNSLRTGVEVRLAEVAAVTVS